MLDFAFTPPVWFMFALVMAISPALAWIAVSASYAWPLRHQIQQIGADLDTAEKHSPEYAYLEAQAQYAANSLAALLQNSALHKKRLLIHCAGLSLIGTLIIGQWGYGAVSLGLAFLVYLLWILAAMDCAYRLIPESLIMLVAGAGCIASLVIGKFYLSFGAREAVFAFACVCIVLAACVSCVNALRSLRGRRQALTIGSGDVLLILALCFWLGFDVLLAAAVGCIVMLVLQGWFAWQSQWPERIDPQRAFVFPFVPGLLVGVLIAIFLPRPEWLEFNRAASLIVQHLTA